MSDNRERFIEALLALPALNKPFGKLIEDMVTEREDGELEAYCDMKLLRQEKFTEPETESTSSGLMLLLLDATSEGATPADKDRFDRAMDEVER